MVEAANSLVLDLVEWIAREPRPYPEVIATWRTSCPRLTIWEDAVDSGYVTRHRRHGRRHRGRQAMAARARPFELSD